MFAREDQLSDQVLSALAATGVDCEVLYPSDNLVPGDEAALKAAVARLGLGLRPIDRVLHLWCSAPLTGSVGHQSRITALEAELELGFYTLLFAFQEITEQQGAHPLRLDIIADGVHPVASTESNPERALLLGPTLVLGQDYPFVTGRSIEIGGMDDAAAEVLDELLCASSAHAVALEPGRRWVRSYERDVLPPLSDGSMPLRLQERGVYLITGGLGGIGMTLAEYLVRQCRARLVLTGLDAVPGPDSDPDDALLRRRSEQIRALEALGGEVMAARCDAADLSATRNLFAEIDRRFGRLDGVVHAAGVFESQRAFRSIAETGRDDCRRRLLPKVQATLVLAECLNGRKLDFVLTQSSLSAQLGGLGFYAYTAGNAYMDSFTERHRSVDLPWMTVNWDGWIFRERDEDAPRESVVSPSFASPDFGVVAEIAIRPREGAEIYGRLMNISAPRQVLISTADFGARIEQWVNADHDMTSLDDVKRSSGWEDPLEERIATIWSEMLGAEDLRTDSNFFAAGGDSLLGVALAYRLSVEFSTVFSAITLFENATIRQMAKVVRQTASIDSEEN